MLNHLYSTGLYISKQHFVIFNLFDTYLFIRIFTLRYNLMIQKYIKYLRSFETIRQTVLCSVQIILHLVILIDKYLVCEIFRIQFLNVINIYFNNK